LGKIAIVDSGKGGGEMDELPLPSTVMEREEDRSELRQIM